MSLIVKVQINEDRIGTVSARRMTGTSEPDSIGTYEYRVFYNKGVSHLVETIARGEVTHRYGDGAFVLLRRVLEAANLKGTQ